VLWKFKHKTPGFGIQPGYYMTVLSSKPALSPLLAVVNPKGEGGAVAGFGVPLASDSTKEDLARPMTRGIYALSSPDRKTVLKLRVVSKEEAGFDPAPFLRSPMAAGLDKELLARISATWTLMQLTFESYDPMVYEGVRFMLGCCRRLAELHDGVVADPIAQTYRLPDQVFTAKPADARIDARDVVQVFIRPRRDEPSVLTSYTLGMQKFGMAEMEMPGLSSATQDLATRFLFSLAQSALLGRMIDLGDRVGDSTCMLQVAPGGLDRGMWEGIECYELIPPSGRTVDEALLAWAATSM
jgi:hypothetical protein